MNLSNNNNPREIVPRIRDYKTTAALGELDAISKSSKQLNMKLQNGNEILRKYDEWKKGKSISFAADLLNSAIVSSEKEIAREVATFILSIDNENIILLKNLANSVLEDEANFITDKPMQNFDVMKKIRELKQNLVLYPKNSIAWCELSRLYILLRQYPNAENSLLNAYRINPNNRYVLRMAVGLFVHLNEPEKAKFYLNKSDLLKYDPWLMANDIVVSGMIEKTSRYINEGKRLIESQNLSDKSLTELSSVLATIEMSNGKRKKAKQLYRLSLSDPTENSLAQALWAFQVADNIVEFENVKSIKVPLDFEAEFYKYQNAKMLDKSLIEINKWINDQPFSREAYYHGSYVAAVGLRKYSVAVNLLRRGLEYTPNDFLLLNNLTFSYLKQNDMVEAEKTYKKLMVAFNNDNSISNKIVFLATTGLLNYKLNRSQIGRDFYEEAIKLAKQTKYKNAEVLCKIYLATEELLLDSSECTQYFNDAVDSSLGIDEIEILNELDFLKTLAKNKLQ